MKNQFILYSLFVVTLTSAQEESIAPFDLKIDKVELEHTLFHGVKLEYKFVYHLSFPKKHPHPSG